MNTYHAFYRGEEIEVKADTLLSAKRKAVELLGVKLSKTHMVSVVLVALADEKEIAHIAVD